MAVHRAPIISAAARNNVPVVYSQSVFARDMAPSMESMAWAGTSVPWLRYGYVSGTLKRTEFRALARPAPPCGRTRRLAMLAAMMRRIERLRALARRAGSGAGIQGGKDRRLGPW